jgi:hypothetical protein
MITPAAAIERRLAGIQAAVERIFAGDGPARVGEAAELPRPALERCTAAGRVLFAANRELAWPEPPALALWHAATLVREHRGDGHVAALVTAGIEPCEAHVLRLAVDGSPPESIRPYRGWGDDEGPPRANDYASAAGSTPRDGRPSSDATCTTTWRHVATISPASSCASCRRAMCRG